MADPRPQQLTLPNTIVNVVETSIVDFIAVNSGTCTGQFESNQLKSNIITNSLSLTTDHLIANSGTLTGLTTSDTFQANKGIFLTTLTISGTPVDISGGGISSLSEDPSPTLGGNLSGNSNSITGLAGVTANTGNFPVSCTAGAYNGNSMSLALTANADHFVANSGTFITDVRLQGVLKIGSFTTTERDALTVESGMLIFNSTTNALNFYNGTSWMILASV